MDGQRGQDYNATCVALTDGQIRLGLVDLFSWDQMWQKVLGGAVLFVIVKRNYEYFYML